MPDYHERGSRRSLSPRRERGRDHSRGRDRDRSKDRYRRDNSRDRSRVRSDVREKERRERRDHSSRRSHSRSRSRSPKRRRDDAKKQRRQRSRSRSSRSTNSSESDEERRRKKRRKEKRRRYSGSRERKDRKKEKGKKKKTGAVTSQWGKYGVINETDLYNKEEEFRTWLVEECKVNPETMSKDQTKKQFAKFVEDYNTATLPHEKFYDMKRYEARMSMLRHGEFVPQGDEDTYDPDADLRAHSSAHKRIVAQQESYLSTEQLKELRRVERERVEVKKRKQLGLEVSQTLGVRMEELDN